MKKYLSFFRLRFSMGLQYRTAAFAGMLTQVAWGFLLILTYKAFYETDAAAFPMTFQATVSYLWMQQAFLTFFGTWMVESEILDSIMNGNIAYELCRPVSIYRMWFARGAANRVSRALLRCFPVLIVSVIMPKPYRLCPPASARHFLLFAVTMVLGMLVAVALCMLLYMLAFFTISPRGLLTVFSSVAELFCGAVIPLPFFPEKVKAVLELLPFAAIQNVPLRIYSGSMTVAETRRAVGLQTFWLVALVFAGSLLAGRAEKKVTVQGG